jgi:hypothetical protein
MKKNMTRARGNRTQKTGHRNRKDFSEWGKKKEKEFDS